MDVAILDDYQAVAQQMADWSQLPPGINVQFFHDHIADEDALVDRLKNFQVVMGMRERTPFPRSVLDRLPELRLLVTAGMGNAVFDIPAATELGIVVTGTGGVGEGPTELTWGLILALARRIPQEDRLTREGNWGTTVGIGLKDKTLGLLGLGHIGSLVGKVGAALGMSSRLSLTSGALAVIFVIWVSDTSNTPVSLYPPPPNDYDFLPLTEDCQRAFTNIRNKHQAALNPKCIYS